MAPRSERNRGHPDNSSSSDLFLPRNGDPDGPGAAAVVCVSPLPLSRLLKGPTKGMFPLAFQPYKNDQHAHAPHRFLASVMPRWKTTNLVAILLSALSVRPKIETRYGVSCFLVLGFGYVSGCLGNPNSWGPELLQGKR